MKLKDLKRAIKKGEDDPFLYTNQEMHFLKKALREYHLSQEKHRKAINNGFGN